MKMEHCSDPVTGHSSSVINAKADENTINQ